jgi:lipopolysaccharide export LptBFGC system permease protein LptF
MRFLQFSFFNKILNMANENKTSEFVKMILKNKDILKKFDFIKLAKGKKVDDHRQEIRYTHSVRSKEYPNIARRTFYSSTDSYPYWLILTFANNQLAAKFNVIDEEDIEYLKKYLRKPRKVYSKKDEPVETSGEEIERERNRNVVEDESDMEFLDSEDDENGDEE